MQINPLDAFYIYIYIYIYNIIYLFCWPTHTDQSKPHPARARSQLTSSGACIHRRNGSTNSPPLKNNTNVMHPECGQRQGGTTPTTLPQAAPALPRLKPELGTWHHAHFAAVPLMKCRGHTPTLRARAASEGRLRTRHWRSTLPYIYIYIYIYFGPRMGDSVNPKADMH